MSHAHPDPGESPDVTDRYDLVILGGGTAGLVSAFIAAGVGARVPWSNATVPAVTACGPAAFPARA